MGRRRLVLLRLVRELDGAPLGAGAGDQTRGAPCLSLPQKAPRGPAEALRAAFGGRTAWRLLRQRETGKPTRASRAEKPHRARAEGVGETDESLRARGDVVEEAGPSPQSPRGAAMVVSTSDQPKETGHEAD